MLFIDNHSDNHRSPVAAMIHPLEMRCRQRCHSLRLAGPLPKFFLVAVEKNGCKKTFWRKVGYSMPVSVSPTSHLYLRDMIQFCREDVLLRHLRFVELVPSSLALPVKLIYGVVGAYPCLRLGCPVHSV